MSTILGALTGAGLLVAQSAGTMDISDDTIVSTGGDRVVLDILHDLADDEPFQLRIFNADFSGDGNVDDDTIVQFGYNTGSPRGDPTKPALYLQFERKFRDGNKPEAFEYMMQHVGEDGTIRRPFGFYLPRAGSVDGSNASFEIDLMAFKDWNGNVVLNLDLKNRAFYVENGAYFSFSRNNTPLMYQLNGAANSLLPLPYINTRDQLQQNTASYFAAPSAINHEGFRAYQTATYLAPTDLSFGRYETLGGPVTGRFWQSFFQGSVSGSLINEIRNLHATGGVRMILKSLGEGDTTQSFWSGDDQWTIGHLASDGSFRLSNFGHIGHPLFDAFWIAPRSGGYLASFAGPVRLPSYTLAGLPSASQMGAGALVYVTDASGGPITAVSNGSSWILHASGEDAGAGTAQTAAMAAPEPVPVASAGAGTATAEAAAPIPSPAGATAVAASAAESTPDGAEPDGSTRLAGRDGAVERRVGEEEEFAGELIEASSAPADGDAAPAVSGARAPAAVAVAAAPADHQPGHVVLGSSSSTYSAPGLGSAASQAAQSGPTYFVTSDSAGNLAYSSVGPADVMALTARVGTVEGQVAALEFDLRRANGGIAAAMALGGTMIPPGKSVAVSLNVATFAGEQGFSASGVARISDNAWVNAGVAGSTVGGSTGGRAGITLGW